ncbi:amino acid permease [Ectobacillus ponti]|uniref:Amino acid permease n=1 Tax=Ectobacillus ponti TaxID=2961894 RepID=A0AA41XAK5_9BACI|nr:amino acid permease [Ectobacillus ponti]MCP8969950.1 amino acid permease [Ectobacillus ponti]
MEKKNKGLTVPHLTMMALGSVIGSSFFLGSSLAISAAGPSILISYILAGALIYLILFALSELTVADPSAGSFSTFATRNLGPGVGFVVGWLYWTGTVLGMSSEATAITILVQKFYPGVAISWFGSAIIIGVTLLNLLGVEKIGKLTSGLSSIKLLTIVLFILGALTLIFGLLPGRAAIGVGELANQPLMPGGITSIAGSMLLVVFAYAGFEVIALASAEVRDPQRTIPRAIRYTVITLVGLYVLYAIVLLPLIPTASLNENISPMVASLSRWGIGWAGTAINVVLITASLSTMMASIFAVGRMIRSLVEEEHGPKWLKDKTDVPYRGILFSGGAMLLGLGFGLLFPRVYLVLITTSGFTLLFTYAVIMASHIRFRKTQGCPPTGDCQMPGHPYTSWIALISLVVILLSMPLIKGQGTGLITGLAATAAYSLLYLAIRSRRRARAEAPLKRVAQPLQYRTSLLTEYSRELGEEEEKDPEK